MIQGSYRIISVKNEPTVIEILEDSSNSGSSTSSECDYCSEKNGTPSVSEILEDNNSIIFAQSEACSETEAESCHFSPAVSEIFEYNDGSTTYAPSETYSELSSENFTVSEIFEDIKSTEFAPSETHKEVIRELFAGFENATNNGFSRSEAGNEIYTSQQNLKSVLSKNPKRRKRHPTIPKMADKAILEKSHPRKGLSVIAVKKYMQANYGVNIKYCAKRICNYIRNSIESGHLIQISGIGANGSVQLAANIKRHRRRQTKLQKQNKRSSARKSRKIETETFSKRGRRLSVCSLGK